VKVLGLKELSLQLLCPSFIPWFVGLGQAWVINRVYTSLEALNLAVAYGFSAITVKTDTGDYALGVVYSVDSSGYRLLEFPEPGNDWIRVTAKVFAVPADKLSKMFKKAVLEPFSERTGDLRRRGATCWGRNRYTCLLSTGLNMEFSLEYLFLAVKCSDNAVKVESLELFDQLVDSLRYPIHALARYIAEVGEETEATLNYLLYRIDKSIIAFISDFIIRGKLVLPKIRDLESLINYVRSHYKWWSK